MNKKEYSIKRLLFRTTCFLVAGVMTSLVFVGTIDTYSWFTSRAGSNFEVAAASTEDIVKIIGLEYSKSTDVHNPVYIVLEGAENLSGPAMLYFSVEGDISEYALHINPVLIEANRIYKVPIETNINTTQYADLLAQLLRKPVITGNIKVKYLNQFINESIDVSFTNKHLREMLLKAIDRKDIVILESTEEARDEITTLITYLASHLSWSNDAPVQELMDASVRSLAMRSEGFRDVDADAAVVFETVPIEKYELNEDQGSIISIIAPTLQGYLDKAYNTIVDLVARINELQQQVRNLEGNNNELNQILAEYKLRTEGLEAENRSLRDTNESLKETIARLEDELRQDSTGSGPVNPPAVNPSEPTAGDGKEKGDTVIESDTEAEEAAEVEEEHEAVTEPQQQGIKEDEKFNEENIEDEKVQ